jgi:hypothetical protein
MTQDLPQCLRPPTDGSPWAPPLDASDLVVRLEVSGVTDAVAKVEYGFSDTWQMAVSYLPALQQVPPIEKHEATRAGLVRHYLRGISFAFPLLLCSLAMVYFGFSLWGGTIESKLAAAVGLGTVLSFISTGGVIQTMARRSIFFAGVREYKMSETSCWWWTLWGLVSLAVYGVALLAASAYFDLLPHPLNLVAFGFHTCLGLFWLSAGILYTLEDTAGIVVAAAVGIAWVIATQEVWNLDLALSQLTGILLASAVAFGISAVRMRWRSRKDTSRTRPQRLALDLYLAWPYFLFGAIYYFFLFVDRLLAWTASTFGAPLSLEFRGPYETGVDIALFAFILQVGWVHPAAARFFDRVQVAQKRFAATLAAEFSRDAMRRYHVTLVGFLPLAIAVSAVTYAAAVWFGLFENPIIHRTMIWAAAGYTCVVVGLFNTSLLFRLSEPIGALRPVALAAAVNLSVGYILSRLISYEMAAAGFALGAAFFAVLSTKQVQRRLRALDYYYFASAS